MRGRNKKILPDFQSGGLADFSNYNDGKKGGKVRVRAKIEEIDKKTLQITELPYNVTTTSLIDSILRANEKGKIKIKNCLLYTSPSPRDNTTSRMPSSA